MPSSTTSYCNSVIHEPCRVWEADWLWKLLFTTTKCSMYCFTVQFTLHLSCCENESAVFPEQKSAKFSHPPTIDRSTLQAHGTRIPMNGIEPLQYHHHGCHHTQCNGKQMWQCQKSLCQSFLAGFRATCFLYVYIERKKNRHAYRRMEVCQLPKSPCARVGTATVSTFSTALCSRLHPQSTLFLNLETTKAGIYLDF